MSKKKILIIDDEELIRHSLKTDLTAAGFVVSIVESGEKELHADTKVNLNDLMMPLIKVSKIENKVKLNKIPEIPF